MANENGNLLKKVPIDEQKITILEVKLRETVAEFNENLQNNIDLHYKYSIDFIRNITEMYYKNYLYLQKKLEFMIASDLKPEYKLVYQNIHQHNLKHYSVCHC